MSRSGPTLSNSPLFDEDPEPVTLTYMPRTGRSGAAVGWLLLGLAVGIMAGWTLFI